MQRHLLPMLCLIGLTPIGAVAVADDQASPAPEVITSPDGRIRVEVQLIADGEQRQIERKVRIEGALDDAQRARLLEIAAKTPVTRLFKEGSRISTALAVE